MGANRFVAAMAALLLLLAARSAADAIEPGITKADLLAKHGKPLSTAGGGKRELLTYPDGRVTIENGVVTRFEPATASSSSSASTAAAPTTSPNALQQHADPRATRAGWLSSLEDAVAKASAENKPIIFLLSGNMDQCPWGKRFSEVVEYSDHFVRRIRGSYVPLRINISDLGGSYEASSKEEFDQLVEGFKAVENLRNQVFSSQMVPSLAVLSSDGKQSTEVDMTGALEAMTRGKLDEYTMAQIKVAQDGPRKNIESYASATRKKKLYYLVGGIALAVILIKKFKG